MINVDASKSEFPYNCSTNLYTPLIFLVKIKYEKKHGAKK